MLKSDNHFQRTQLNHFRERHQSLSVKHRLKGLPFSSTAARALFRMDENKATGICPCGFFGRQLVLKIVDELLDDGATIDTN